MGWDSDLADDVSAELFWDPNLENVAIAVAANAGEATLCGTVGSLREKRSGLSRADRSNDDHDHFTPFEHRSTTPFDYRLASEGLVR